MDSSYRPQSPDLSTYAPQSPDLSGLRPQTPDFSGALPSPRYGHHHTRSRDHLGVPSGSNPFPHQPTPTSYPPQYQQHQQFDMAGSRLKVEDDDEYLPDAADTKRARGRLQPSFQQDQPMFDNPHTSLPGPIQDVPSQPADPTLGVQLKTSFPVARIKRIMQADEDIGKVAQVTPHVVSRALELFMIKLISASAIQAAGPAGAAGGGKGPKRIQAQHMKRAIASDETFDFLQDIIAKVPDAPVKGKKEAGSDSEEGASGGKAPKRRGGGKRRKDSGDDF